MPVSWRLLVTACRRVLELEKLPVMYSCPNKEWTNERVIRAGAAKCRLALSRQNGRNAALMTVWIFRIPLPHTLCLSGTHTHTYTHPLVSYFRLIFSAVTSQEVGVKNIVSHDILAVWVRRVFDRPSVCVYCWLRLPGLPCASSKCSPVCVCVLELECGIRSACRCVGSPTDLKAMKESLSVWTRFIEPQHLSSPNA